MLDAVFEPQARAARFYSAQITKNGKKRPKHIPKGHKTNEMVVKYSE
jgi:hypothetical protein